MSHKTDLRLSRILQRGGAFGASYVTELDRIASVSHNVDVVIKGLPACALFLFIQMNGQTLWLALYLEYEQHHAQEQRQHLPQYELDVIQNNDHCEGVD